MVSDGTIWERDITTIGGVNQFAPGQIPIFRDNNFIITIRNDGSIAKQYNSSDWKDTISGNIWTLETISATTSELEEQNDTKIVIKQDYYDFCDFAYYGSLSELFRASINDIVRRFPGELYGSKVSGMTYYTSDGESKILGEEDGFTYEVLNPFGIDIHTVKRFTGIKHLKYFANEGYKEYTVNGKEIISWEVEMVNTKDQFDCSGDVDFNVEDGKIVSELHADCFLPGEKIAIITITTEDNMEYVIELYMGEERRLYYMHSGGTMTDAHIRPKEKYIEAFYNNCDAFQRLLMNRDSSPAKYTATFSVIKETERGFKRESESFSFPIDEGGYNIDTSSFGFSSYTKRFADIGALYDEYFTDNLYRSMTHESIKNFDWTHTRRYDPEENEPFQTGAEKIQKVLRLFAREFDEVKSYIDNITSFGRITYDDRSNVPNYFLTDVCEDDGWDIIQVIPYETTLSVIGDDEDYIIPQIIGDASLDVSGQTLFRMSSRIMGIDGADNLYMSGETKFSLKDINEDRNCSEDIDIKAALCYPNTYVQNTKRKVKPYSFDDKDSISDYVKNGYFVSCCSGDGISIASEFAFPCDYSGNTNYFIKDANDGSTIFFDKCSGKIKNRVKAYSNEMDTYTFMDVNNEFLRRLKLNSKYIWRHKGTEEGIEMILAMFGLKSKKWWDKKDECYRYKYSNSGYDYEITEYTRFVEPIIDIDDNCHSMHQIDWVNSTKTIAYDYRTVSAYEPRGISYTNYVPYQGMPVIYEDRVEVSENEFDEISENFGVWEYLYSTEKEQRYLYPNFNKNEQYDGNPYYQMNGGWLSKTIVDSADTKYNFQFTAKNVPVYDKDDAIYKETVRSIRRVGTLNELMSIPSEQLKDGYICFVERLDGDMIAIDGQVFDIHTDIQDKKYVSFTKSRGILQVGDKFFDDSVSVYGADGEICRYSLIDKNDGYTLNAYLIMDEESSAYTFYCGDDLTNYSIDYYHIIETGDTNMSNYFKLGDANFSTTIEDGMGLGWHRLSVDSPEYKKIDTIWNYNKGNNPHNGNMSYDSGEEYYEYFKHLFKYPYENNLFDERCFSDFVGYGDIGGYFDYIDYIYDKASFDISGDTEIPDTKVHFFGNYKRPDGIDERFCKYAISNGIKYVVTGDTYRNVEENFIGNNFADDDYDRVTNKIMNNKKLNIEFNMKFGYNTPEGQSKLKFFDEIVMNYLTQLIPSTSIVNITYKFTDTINADCCC